MHIKVQGHLMHARFSEINQVFAKKKKSDTTLTEKKEEISG